MIQCETDISTAYEPIVQVLAYYDLFQYPLTEHEILTFVPAGAPSSLELSGALAEAVIDGTLRSSRGFYFLPHREPVIVDRRLRMEKEGERMWRIAQRVGQLMRHVPFVRGVFISGQLCRYIADEESDIDYFIVTEPGRLWLVRTVFVAIRRTLLLNNRKYFCTNYFVTTDNMVVRERNPYTACEVASLKPMYNRPVFDQFIEQNDWVSEYYPNFSLDRMELRAGVEGRSRLQRLVEWLIPRRVASALDLRLMEVTRKFWHRKFPNAAPDVYENSLRTCRDESRAHPEDKTTLVLTAYKQTLHRYGLMYDRNPFRT